MEGHSLLGLCRCRFFELSNLECETRSTVLEAAGGRDASQLRRLLVAKQCIFLYFGASCQISKYRAFY